ncbi:hypothetical protein AB0K16_53460 [Nonomuraea jabiensis]|uniref:hypothetical protein n=1 Tax=Nonomuraea jabiensis TaxID=882448 RepID=UPI003437E8D1
MFGDRRYFRALLTGSIEGIASNILADRLVRLVEAGSSPAAPPREGSALATASPKPVSRLFRSSTPSATGASTGVRAAPRSGADSSSCAMRVRRSSKSSWTSFASATSAPRRSRTTVQARSSVSRPPTPRPPSKSTSINGDGTTPALASRAARRGLDAAGDTAPDRTQRPPGTY